MEWKYNLARITRKTQRILIVKLAAIGDVVMALPMVEALRKIHPESKITWVCGETVSPLLNKIAGIDEIISLDERQLLSGPVIQRIFQLASIWIKLFGRRYDLVLTGHADPRYFLLSLTTIARERRRFSHYRKRPFPLPGRHHTDEYVRLATGKEGPSVPVAALPVLDVPMPDRLRDAVRPDTRGTTIALAPGGAKNVLRDDALRRWPLERYRGLAERLLDHGCGIIITGSKEDQWVCKAFEGLEVVDLVGKTDLLDLVAVYRSCDIVVTHDSGPLHIAALAGKPVVSLFGPTSPLEKASRMKESKALWGGEQLSCRPCYDGKNFARCESNECMKSIRVDDVYKVLMNIVEKDTDDVVPL